MSPTHVRLPHWFCALAFLLFATLPAQAQDVAAIYTTGNEVPIRHILSCAGMRSTNALVGSVQSCWKS